MKTRHKFVTFWLWLIVIANAVATILKFVDGTWQFPHIAYATKENADLFFFIKHDILHYYHYGVTVVVCCGVVNMLCGIMLLKWQKAGFWMFIASNIIILGTMAIFTILGGITPAVVASLIGSIIAPIILYIILHIKRGEVSSWEQLK